ncbi:MAG: hypothetical protein VW982_04965 [Candidatus Poseidoniales archaeon]|jgi:predicted  nucleic acid-binding Zn-ribbon protein
MAREDRAFRKVNKVLKRVEKHIEDTRDALEDLEIEFEVLKATVQKLKDASRQSEAPIEEPEEDLDIENASNITSMRKF